MTTRNFLLLLIALVLVAFGPGVSGPFMLDDPVHLDKIQLWLDGKLSLFATVVNFRAGPLARPLSMLSFAFNGYFWGMDPYSFKVTNLAIHIANGALIFALLKRVLQRDPVLASRAAILSGFIALWWAVLPVHVSTVLYVMQRMVELSALFSLLGLHAYVTAREHMLQSRPSGKWWLFGVLPLATIAAALSKENGLLTPAFCLVIEMAYFSNGSASAGASSGSRRAVQAFFAIFLFIPAVLGLSWIGLHLDRALIDYQLYDFTLRDRLLTEPRVLWSYVRIILIPNGQLMGLYHDDYPLSKSLFEPTTTVIAIVAWLAVVLAAFRWRRANPALFAGVGLFLCAHAMESTIFPLDIFFEHRNYLAAIGVLLALVGTIVALQARIRDVVNERNARAFGALGAAIVLVFAIATNARAFIWQSQDTILERALTGDPDSRHLRIELIVQALKQRRFADSQTHAQALLASSDPFSRAIGAEWQLIGRCDSHATVTAAEIDVLIASAPPRITYNALAAMETLTERSIGGHCPSLAPAALAKAVSAWLARSDQQATLEPTWRLHYDLGRLLASAGMQPDAREQLGIAWRDSGKEFAVGAQLFSVLLSAGDIPASRDMLRQLEGITRPGAQAEVDALNALRARLAQAAASPPSTVSPPSAPSPNSP